jgi:putative glutamine amidotransferase
MACSTAATSASPTTRACSTGWCCRAAPTSAPRATASSRCAQLINVAFGGTLYQDVATQLPDSGRHVTDEYERHLHEIRFAPGSGLARLYGGLERPRVTSIHHQSIKALGRGLKAEAWSEPDGVVEAVRGSGEGYVFAVQWHPEFHHAGNAGALDCSPILEEFLSAARDA